MRVTLWQRIFIYTIALLVVSQALAFVLHAALYKEDMRRRFAESTREMAKEFRGQSLDMVLRHIRLISGGPTAIWLTNADGSVISDSGSSRESGMLLTVTEEWRVGETVLMEVENDPRLWGKTPLQLQEGVYWLFLSFGPPPPSMKSPFLFQLFAPVLLTSIVLAFWMAWSVSRPLRRLRNEVREMAATGPGNTISVSGKDEISDVAVAVNAMAETLARHVRGMRSLVANVSHELRSPLARANLALGIVEESLPPGYVVREETPGDDAGKRMAAKYLTALQEELNHMDALIGTTLLTQKLVMQQEEVEMKPVDFSALCGNVWERYAGIFTRSMLVPAGKIDAGIIVSGNEPLLMQLLTNLLDNCLKYTSRQGEIRFTAEVRQGKCMVRVENSYELAEEANLDYLFEPFYRMNQATGTGVGLGLSLVQKTVELHHGEIMAAPTEIGLCVCMQLPLAASGDPS